MKYTVPGSAPIKGLMNGTSMSIKPDIVLALNTPSISPRFSLNTSNLQEDSRGIYNHGIETNFFNRPDTFLKSLNLKFKGER